MDEGELASLAIALGAEGVGGPLAPAERSLIERVRRTKRHVPRSLARETRRRIKLDRDPLGDALCDARSQVARRSLGAFYTDRSIVEAMVRWIGRQGPEEIVDCGCGSGRFARAAARLAGVNSVLAVDIDPLSCLITRANAAVLGLKNVRVIQGDFTTLGLESREGKRAFIGNPPYVRHHDLSAVQKVRGRRIAASLGIHFSGLAGLHAHFLMSAAALARTGDVLCFITSAEWLDVNYGQGIRELMMDGMRAEEIHLLDATSAAFNDAASTAVIICARGGGEAEAVRIRNSRTVAGLVNFGTGGRLVSRTDLLTARSWGQIVRDRYVDMDARDAVPLGSIVRVHRGAVTGANDFFVMSKERAKSLGLINCVRPALTSAEEVQVANGSVGDAPARKVVLCPPSPDSLARSERDALLAYVRLGEERELDKTYVASRRTPWWRPQFKAAPPVVATYMARQPPTFALNPDGLLILNVIHGLYPVASLDEEQLRLLVQTLNNDRARFRGSGRTYQGGLEKFEPREMERLLLRLPSPEKLSMLCDG